MAVSSSSNDIPSRLSMDLGSDYETGSSTEDAITVHLDSERTKAWPQDFFVGDIVKGFAEIDAGLLLKKPLAVVFEELFGVDFTSSTYYDHRGHWNTAHAEAKELTLSFHRQRPEGLWSFFMRTNPAENAKRIAMRRQIWKHGKKKGTR